MRKRITDHVYSKTSLIGRAFRKYGISNIDVKILAIGCREYIYDLEKKAISAFDTMSPNGYNCHEGGQGGDSGCIVTVETRQKLSEKLSGLKRTEETKRRISESKKGTKCSEETKQKLSDAMMGRKFSETHQQRLSDANKRRTGCKHTDETRLKMRQAWVIRKMRQG